MEPAAWFGELLVEALKIACNDKHFKMLSQADRCEFSIGDNGDGGYIGWNNYNERKK